MLLEHCRPAPDAVWQASSIIGEQRPPAARDNSLFRFVRYSLNRGTTPFHTHVRDARSLKGLTTVEPINARSMLDVVAADAAARTDAPRIERRRRLSPAALAVTNQKVRRAYSPIVIAGVVRVIDFGMLSAIGVALYFAYVVPLSNFNWDYVGAIFAMSAAAVVCFQASDIYQVQVFRGQLRQMTRMISSWAFVFLLFIGVSFLAKLGSEISRVWLSAFFFTGLAALIIERVF